MHSVQSYCRRLPTEVLEQLLQNHEAGIEKQCDMIVKLIEEILEERKEERHPGS